MKDKKQKQQQRKIIHMFHLSIAFNSCSYLMYATTQNIRPDTNNAFDKRLNTIDIQRATHAL